MVDKWIRYGTICNINKGNSGRPTHARTEEIIALVNETIQESPSRRVKKLAAEVGMKRETVRSVLKKDLRLKSYKIQTIQHITDNDNARRLQFCSKIKETSQQRRLDANTIIFSDKSHIYLNGFVNKQNIRIWSAQRPIEVFRSNCTHRR